jgi:hypothetical protein
MRIDVDGDEVTRLNSAKQLWASIMPPAIPVPDDHTFFIWVTGHIQVDVERAICAAAKSMAKNIYQRVVLEEDAAARYCSSVLKNETAWRRSKKRERQERERRGNGGNAVLNPTRGTRAC